MRVRFDLDSERRNRWWTIRNAAAGLVAYWDIESRQKKQGFPFPVKEEAAVFAHARDQIESAIKDGELKTQPAGELKEKREHTKDGFLYVQAKECVGDVGESIDDATPMIQALKVIRWCEGKGLPIEEKVRFSFRPAIPRWEFWLNKALWSEQEAINLLCEIEPGEPIPDETFIEGHECIPDLQPMIHDAVVSGELKDPDVPSRFVSWAANKGLSISEPLSGLAHDTTPAREPTRKDRSTKTTPMKKFLTPRGAKWSDVSLVLIQDREIRINVMGQTETRTLRDMGLIDGRNNKPGILFGLLKDLATSFAILQPSKLAKKQAGEFLRDQSEAKRTHMATIGKRTMKRESLAANVKNLRNVLRAIFGIEGDPIPLGPIDKHHPIQRDTIVKEGLVYDDENDDSGFSEFEPEPVKNWTPAFRVKYKSERF